MRRGALAALCVAVLAGPSAALAGRPLNVGAVEDAAIWGNPYAQMDMARLAGYGSVRMSVQWNWGQVAPDRAQFAKVQTAVSAALSRGIRPILAIYDRAGGPPPADPGSQALFVQFVRAVVVATPGVSTFVIGNEPNSPLYWRPQFDTAGGDPAARSYEQLLAASYDAIKAIRPSATVVGGALDPRGNDRARLSHSPTTFIRDLGAAYRASGRNRPLMDEFDEHVYADSSALPPSMSHPRSPNIGVADYRKLVRLLGKAFDGTAQRGSTLPILYGEFGVETTDPAGRGAPLPRDADPGWVSVGERTQAAYYAQALKLVLCQPHVTGILFFHVEDESDLAGWQSGIYYADGRPKSLFAAVKTAVHRARAGTLASCPDHRAPPLTVRRTAARGTITAKATDNVGVGRVVLTVNGARAGVRYTPPYVFRWRPTSSRRYVVRVAAVDAAGNVSSGLTLAGVDRPRHLR